MHGGPETISKPDFVILSLMRRCPVNPEPWPCATPLPARSPYAPEKRGGMEPERISEFPLWLERQEKAPMPIIRMIVTTVPPGMGNQAVRNWKENVRR